MGAWGICFTLQSLSYRDVILSVSPCAVLLPADPLWGLGCKWQRGFCWCSISRCAFPVFHFPCAPLPCKSHPTARASGLWGQGPIFCHGFCLLLKVSLGVHGRYGHRPHKEWFELAREKIPGQRERGRRVPAVPGRCCRRQCLCQAPRSTAAAPPPHRRVLGAASERARGTERAAE